VLKIALDKRRRDLCPQFKEEYVIIEVEIIGEVWYRGRKERKRLSMIFLD